MGYTERTGVFVHKPQGLGVFWYFEMYTYSKQLVFFSRLTNEIHKGDYSDFIFIFNMDILIAFQTECMSFCNFSQ